MNRPELATALTELLSLDLPPVALSKVDARPPGVADTGRPVPSSCALWRVAEKGVFYAEAAEHFNCPVGAMVMGFEMPEELNAELGGLVRSMCDARYLEESEVASIPSVRKPGVGVVYGPLADLPVEPDVVLLWLTPAQAMIYNEAAGTANWTSPGGQVTGRPACSAVALATGTGQPRMALGCIGMRTFTGIAADRMLAVLPGAAVAGFVEALRVTVAANAGMKSFYEGKLAQFAF
ncbi:MAG: DUF169 domain-containing protein [Saccharothrix sp.]|nr:DUF169 domain-containing protein [Saccharothrix sp.]